MDTFTEGKDLRTHKTPLVVVTEKYHFVARKVYTESLTKKGLKFMEDYKTDLSFQSLFTHVNFQMKFSDYNEQLPNTKGLRTPDILFNDYDWD